MSRALIATILLSLDARMGEWVAFAELQRALGCKPEHVREACDDLVAARQMQHAQRDGVDYYGVRVQGTP